MSGQLGGGSLGRQHAVRACGPFIVSQTRHDAGFSATSHVHERASLNIVLAGGYAESRAGTSVMVTTGGALAKPAWETHANHFRATGARCLLIEIDTTSLSLLRDCTDLFEAPALRDARAQAEWSKSLLALLPADDATSALEIESMSYQLVAGLSRNARAVEERRPDGWLVRVRQMLHDLEPSDLSLARIGTEVGRHPAHVARAFRRRHGCTIGSFVRRLQVMRARKQLSQSPSVALSTIALAVGFYDQSHFTREFRRHTGETPGAFRARALGR